MTHRLRQLAIASFVVGSAYGTAAVAHCGSAFCLVNTSWDAQGLWDEPGSRLELRHEYIDQDELEHPGTAGEHGHDATSAAATANVTAGASGMARVLGGEHDHAPQRTESRITTLAYEHTWNRTWGVSVAVPWIDRRHEDFQFGHDDHPGHVHVSEFSRLGDARVVVRRAFDTEGDDRYGVRFGVKLPTGSHDAPGPHGSTLDRSLQPGTGTIDAIVGFYANGRVDTVRGWFGQATMQQPLGERDGYRPGARVQVDAGISQAFGPRVLGLLQANAHWSAPDHGAQAARDDSGARRVSVSPGIDVVLGTHANLYVFVEKPVWQRVNGEQLTADWAVAAGASWMF